MTERKLNNSLSLVKNMRDMLYPTVNLLNETYGELLRTVLLGDLKLITHQYKVINACIDELLNNLPSERNKITEAEVRVIVENPSVIEVTKLLSFHIERITQTFHVHETFSHEVIKTISAQCFYIQIRFRAFQILIGL